MFGFYPLVIATLVFDTVLLGFLIWAFHSPRFADRRIQLGPSMKVSMGARLKNVSVSSAISLGVVIGSTVFLRSALFHDRPTPLGTKALQAIGVLLVYDFFYYWLHRGMHVKKVMRFVHGVHHKAKNPSALESFYLHPLELLAGLGLLVLSTWIIGPVHEQAFVAAFFVYSTLNIVIHSGLDFRGRVLFPVNFLTRKHHVHHFHDFGKNFSSLTPIPDLLFGTAG